MKKQWVRQRLGTIAAIATARTEAKLSQRALSEKLGGPITLMQKIESGERNVTIEEFIRIAVALDVDPQDLFRRVLKGWPASALASTPPTNK